MPYLVPSLITNRLAVLLFDNVDPNSQGLDAVKNLIINMVDIALLSAGALSVIFIIVGGFRYVISAGNPKEVAQAKATITFAVVGLIIAILAIVIVKFVSGIFT
jgi:hypothetical protein